MADIKYTIRVTNATGDVQNNKLVKLYIKQSGSYVQVGNDQYTDSKGNVQFDIAKTGLYKVEIEPPNGNTIDGIYIIGDDLKGVIEESLIGLTTSSSDLNLLFDETSALQNLGYIYVTQGTPTQNKALVLGSNNELTGKIDIKETSGSESTTGLFINGTKLSATIGELNQLSNISTGKVATLTDLNDFLSNVASSNSNLNTLGKTEIFTKGVGIDTGSDDTVVDIFSVLGSNFKIKGVTIFDPRWLEESVTNFVDKLIISRINPKGDDSELKSATFVSSDYSDNDGFVSRIPEFATGVIGGNDKIKVTLHSTSAGLDIPLKITVFWELTDSPILSNQRIAR